MNQKEEYRMEVGKRVKKFRDTVGITQIELLRTFGSRSLESDNKANLIYLIEHGKRGLTEANIKKIAKKYNVQPGYFRLETNYLTEEEELKANSEKFFSEQGIRKQYYQMLLALQGFRVSYKDGKCIITDHDNRSTTFDRDNLLELIADFESHFAFEIQRMIKREADKEQTEELNNLLLTFGEGS